MRNASHVGFSTYVASSGIGPRQSAAVIGARIQVIAGDVLFNSQTGEIVTSVGETSGVSRLDKDVMMNYPNPFNPTTTIEYTLSRTEPGLILNLCDILGREVLRRVPIFRRRLEHIGSYWMHLHSVQECIWARLRSRYPLGTTKPIFVK